MISVLFAALACGLSVQNAVRFWDRPRLRPLSTSVAVLCTVCLLALLMAEVMR